MGYTFYKVNRNIVFTAFITLIVSCTTTPDSSQTPDQTQEIQQNPTEQPEASDADIAPDTLRADASLDGDTDQDADPDQDIFDLDGSISTSVGLPADGTIKGAIAFPKQSPGFQLNPRRLNEESHYATVETVQEILRAAAVVQKELPGGFPLIVNDACFKKGGPIPHHGSHQSGRDLDVLFYLFDKQGKSRPAKGVPLDLKGRGWDFNDLAIPSDDQFVKIDAKRTWRFLQALVENEDTLLQRIYVAEHLRTILLKEARRVKAPRAVRRKVEQMTCQPGSPHDDHFHFRFFCTAEDIAQGCQDSRPMYPWRKQQLAALEVDPVIGRPRPRRKRSKTTSAQEARKKAGKMHWKVIAFLEERKNWSEQPHPRRPYCW